MTNIYDEIDSLSVYYDLCNPNSNADMYWEFVDSFTTDNIIKLTTWWIPIAKGRVPADETIQAQGIMNFYYENEYISKKQHRWLANTIITSWNNLNVVDLTKVVSL
jgi:hypothetical protein